MTRTFALTSTTALLTLLAPQFALAKVSAEDVWANQIAMHKALGGATTGALEVKGNVTTIRDMKVDFALPMNLGAITLKINAIDLVENGDETVTMRYPAGSVIDLSVDVPGQMSGNIAVGFANGTFDARASGEAGNIVYSYDNPGYGVEITEFNLDGPALSNGDLAFLKEFAMTGVVDITDYNGTFVCPKATC